jgi:hypothetical protein
MVCTSRCADVTQSLKKRRGDYEDNIEVDRGTNKRKRFERDIDLSDKYVTVDEENKIEPSRSQRCEGIISRTIAHSHAGRVVPSDGLALAGAQHRTQGFPQSVGG